MTTIAEGTDRFAPATHAILRIGAGILFMEHGVQKLFGMLGGFGAPGATAQLVSLMGLAGVLEVFSRPVALVLALEMVAAFFIAHLPRGGWPIENGGEVPLLYLLVFVFLAANGAGPYSLDERRAG